LLRRIPLNVELRFEERLETEYIVAAYMTLVGPRMDCDAVGSELLYVERYAFEIRVVFTTGIA